MRAEYQITRSEWEEASRMLAAETRHARYAIWIPLGVCAVGAALLVKHDEVRPWIAPLMLVMVGLGLAVARVWSGYAEMDRRWAEGERLRDAVTIETDEDGLLFRSRLWQVRYHWTMFARSVETANLILLYYSPTELLQIVPKRAFALPSDLDSFRVMLDQHIPGTAKGFPVVTKTPQ